MKVINRKKPETRPPEYTMWGQVQHFKEVATGIWCVMTSSHGGYVLSAEREKQFRKLMPKWCSAYSTTREFEEDCDWMAVVLAFPECFSEEKIAKVVEYVSTSDYFPNKYAYEVYMESLKVDDQLRKLSQVPLIQVVFDDTV